MKNCLLLQVLPMLKERMLHAELESRNICCPVFSPQIVGGDLLPGVVTVLLINYFINLSELCQVQPCNTGKLIAVVYSAYILKPVLSGRNL